MSIKELNKNPLSQITENVYLSGVTGVTNVDLMRSAGITHVLNLAAGDASHLTYDLGHGPAIADDDVSQNTSFIKTSKVSTLGGDMVDNAQVLIVRREYLRDSDDQSLLSYLDDLVDFVSKAVSVGGKVVVHCMAGVSRSASVVLAYLVRERAMSLREAHDHVIACRPVIRPNMGFWAALVEYELNIRGENSVEVLDYAAGSVPSLDSYQKEMQLRLRLGWMDHLFYNLAVQFFILIAQMMGSLWIFSDYSK
ncbi:dual specificity protein phosphatase 18 [Elysia marginata]|uniref:Dual specificity protein phosphatase 18 n=1 Tax=Elysia marginata TaxID=1093978 RepID=A0AAV4EA24_9GAST|nr:dual specificity protein phosphatase 18 [Elysia marginata]